MRSFHFNVGNSSTGPIGFCARITAETEELALQKLRNGLDEIGQELDARHLRSESGDYLNVYFNGDFVTVADIDDSQDLDGESEEEEASEA